MTVLNGDDRTKLMRGMFLRRLAEGNPLSEHQLQTAIVQDMSEIARRFSTFNFDSYVGVEVEEFLTAMAEDQLINRVKSEPVEEEEEHDIFSRGSKADEFHDELTEEMGWMVEDLPMSTRGFFDSLKSRPSRKVTLTPDEYMAKHSGSEKDGEPKRLIETASKHDPEDHQLKAGRAKKG